MRRALILSLLAVASIAPGARAGWGANVWNDGRAEVAVYDAERPVNGKTQAYRDEILISRDEVRADDLAKVADTRGVKTVRVFRMIQVDHFKSVNYPMDQECTVLAPANEPDKPLQVTASLQDWIGSTFKRLVVRPDGSAQIAWHTVNDGDQTAELAFQKDDLVADQLVLALRTWPFKEGLRKEVRLWDTIANPHGIAPHVSTAAVTVEAEDLVRCRAGSLPSWKVVVARPGGVVDTYWFEKAEPHVLTKMETADGRKRLLYGRARWSYWDKRLPRPNILN